MTHVPTAMLTSTEWADYEIKYRFKENRLELFRFFQLKRPRIVSSHYPGMRTFFQEIGKQERMKIIFEKPVR